MQTKTVIIMTLFIFQFMTVVGTDIIIPEPELIMTTLSKTIMIGGIEPQSLELSQEPAVITEIGNIPLRKQIPSSCGSTSLAMLFDYLDKPYRDQSYYDKCTNRKPNKGLYIRELKKCADRQGVKTTKDLNYKAERLKTGDIVLYRYKNMTELHYSVVDSISFCEKLNQKIIRLANPHGSYNEYSIEEFKKIYTKEALISFGKA